MHAMIKFKLILSTNTNILRKEAISLIAPSFYYHSVQIPNTEFVQVTSKDLKENIKRIK